MDTSHGGHWSLGTIGRRDGTEGNCLMRPARGQLVVSGSF